MCLLLLSRVGVGTAVAGWWKGDGMGWDASSLLGVCRLRGSCFICIGRSDSFLGHRVDVAVPPSLTSESQTVPDQDYTR